MTGVFEWVIGLHLRSTEKVLYAGDWDLMLIFVLFYDRVYIENTSTLFLAKQQFLSIVTPDGNILAIWIIPIHKPI